MPKKSGTQIALPFHQDQILQSMVGHIQAIRSLCKGKKRSVQYDLERLKRYAESLKTLDAESFDNAKVSMYNCEISEVSEQTTDCKVHMTEILSYMTKDIDTINECVKKLTFHLGYLSACQHEFQSEHIEHQTPQTALEILNFVNKICPNDEAVSKMRSDLKETPVAETEKAQNAAYEANLNQVVNNKLNVGAQFQTNIKKSDLSAADQVVFDRVFNRRPNARPIVPPNPSSFDPSSVDPSSIDPSAGGFVNPSLALRSDELQRRQEMQDERSRIHRERIEAARGELYNFQRQAHEERARLQQIQNEIRTDAQAVAERGQMNDIYQNQLQAREAHLIERSAIQKEKDEEMRRQNIIIQNQQDNLEARYRSLQKKIAAHEAADQGQALPPPYPTPPAPR